MVAVGVGSLTYQGVGLDLMESAVGVGWQANGRGLPSGRPSRRRSLSGSLGNFCRSSAGSSATNGVYDVDNNN
jgi:hypothetical protein